MRNYLLIKSHNRVCPCFLFYFLFVIKPIVGVRYSAKMTPLDCFWVLVSLFSTASLVLCFYVFDNIFTCQLKKTLLPLCSTLCCSSSLMLKYGDHNLQTPASTFEFDHWIISYFQKYIFSNFQAPSCWNQQEMQIIHCKLDPNADRHR